MCTFKTGGDLSAETDNDRPIFRKPSPTMWTVTALVLLYAAWCVLVPVFTLSGHLLNRQSFDCGLGDEFASKLKEEAGLVYIWCGLNVVVCLWLLLGSWIKKSCYIQMGIIVILVAICMIVYYDHLQAHEIQEMQKFKKRYSDFAALPLKDAPRDLKNKLTYTQKNMLANVHCWQTEFKCCGLETYQEWESSIPDSCLCDGEDGYSGCVGVGNSLVYEKLVSYDGTTQDPRSEQGPPCLPTVALFVEKQSSAFQIVIKIWLSIACIPFAIFLFYVLGTSFVLVYFMWELCNPSTWKYKLGLAEKMVPVVFIKKDNNNQTVQGNVEDGKAKESVEDDGVTVNTENGTNVDGEEGEEYVDDNPVKMIPLSQFKRLQEQLDPPPVEHKVLETPLLSLIHTASSKPRNFYTVLLEEGSPLLPSDAVLVDPNKPTRNCYWCEGYRTFNAGDIIWPTQKRLSHQFELMPTA